LLAGLGLLNRRPNEPEHGKSRNEVRDGRERQTLVYDIHGEEQVVLSIVSGDVQSWVKVDKRRQTPTASPTAFVRHAPRYSELTHWLPDSICSLDACLAVSK
jgi:hypothetical protein